MYSSINKSKRSDGMAGPVHKTKPMIGESVSCRHRLSCDMIGLGTDGNGQPHANASSRTDRTAQNGIDCRQLVGRISSLGLHEITLPWGNTGPNP